MVTIRRNLEKKRIELTIASEQTNRIKAIQGLETVSGSGKKYDNTILKMLPEFGLPKVKNNWRWKKNVHN